eukprot:Nitzschia sp. Nitz4//scaffold12_size214221//84508//85179//NITZ4_001498-RA/size214221-processed-gene-0.155-mRNA-1//-1//CDS//3329535014//1973//frame0
MDSPNILLAVTGSVAAVKAPEIAVKLAIESKANVRVLLSQGGSHFWNLAATYDAQSWERWQQLAKQGLVTVIGPDEEWKEWKKLGDPVLHIDLRDWADILVIAPLSAHTLAKMANGLCDDTPTCVVRAWEFGYTGRGKPVVLAPAMNTTMWEHPLTQKQLETVQSFWKNDTQIGEPTNDGVRIVAPQVKTLACGVVGNGALAPVDEICATVRKTLEDFPKGEA